jgi:tellurite resistance protein TehA-like permease
MRDEGPPPNPRGMGPVNRWFLEHVFAAPGGLARFCGVLLLACAVVLAGIAVVVHLDPDSLASDREFFPFITAFFAALGLLFIAVWFVKWVRAPRSR